MLYHHQPHTNTINKPFDLVDLKIQLPPHLAQRFTPQVVPCDAASALQAEEQQPIENASKPLEAKSNDKTRQTLLLMVLPVLPLSACLLSLMPLFLANSNPSADQQGPIYSGCMYLLFAPFTVPVLVGFNLHHKNGHLLSWALAYLSLVLGNVAAVLFCSSSSFCKGQARLWIVSAALSTSALHLLLLINKSNIVLVMISTASAVVICCLVLIAPVLPSLNMAYKCYQSTTLAMLWLFWQATTTAR